MTRKEIFIISLAGIFSLGVVAFLYEEFFSIGTDGVIYALLAKSIAEGHGLTLYGQPHTVFSPLLSALIAPFYTLLKDLELASFLENVVISLFSIPAFYILVKTIHSRKTALMGLALFTINGHFIFSFLSPTPQNISILLGIILFILLYKSSFLSRPRIKENMILLVAGAVVGLMYLARPEYFFLPIPIIIYFAAIYWQQLKAKTTLLIIGVFLFGFSVVSLPYLMFLHKNLGYWTFTGRASATSLYFTNELTVGTDEVRGDNFIVPATKEGRSESLIGSILKDPGPAAKKLFKGLRDSERNITRVFGFLGIGLFAIGIRRYLLDRRFKELAIAVIILSPVLAIALGQGGSTNYLFQFFFIIILFAAIGLSDILEDIKEKLDLSFRSARTLTALLVLITSFYLFIPVPQNYLFTPRENILKEYKQMGLWIKNNFPEAKDQILLSRKPETSFYAEVRFELIPKNLGVSGLVDFMQAHHITYLVVDERHFKKEYIQLMALLDPKSSPKELKYIHSIDYLGNKILLYKLI